MTPQASSVGSRRASASSLGKRDQQLIEELQQELHQELQLVPEYDALCLQRWLIGWDRRKDCIVPRLRNALTTIHALGLPAQDLSSIEKITAYCDQIGSEAVHYLPGTLLGYDREGNVVSLQALGRLDGTGLMQSVCISDLYVSRIAESYGVLKLLNQNDHRTGRQSGTVLIIDLDGLSRDNISLKSTKIITGMLSQLQDLFPDVVRRIYIIRYPGFLSAIWTLITPVLSSQTQKKIVFLGADWKQRLQESIDERILFKHWGGTREAPTEYGNVRMGGALPKSLHYSPAADPNDLSELKEVNVRARNKAFVDVDVKSGLLKWWWQTAGGDLDFWVVRVIDECLVWPKFRLLTEYVPESRTIHVQPGLYRLFFDNSHGLLWSKTVKYKLWDGPK